MSQQLESTRRRSGTLTSQELEISLGQATARNISLWDVLLERAGARGHARRRLQRSLNLPLVRIESVEIEAAAVKAVAGWLARKHNCLPIRFTGKNLVVAMANPLDRRRFRTCSLRRAAEVEPVVASAAEILRASRSTTGQPAAGRSERDRRGPAVCVAAERDAWIRRRDRSLAVGGRSRPPFTCAA